MTRAAFSVADTRSTVLRPLNYIPAVERMRRISGSVSSQPLGALLRTFGRSYGAVFTRLDCDFQHGIELLSQSDMFSSEPQGRRIRIDSLPVPERHRIHKDQVLLAGAGTLGKTELYGRAVYADERLEGKYVGPDALVLEFAEPGSDAALCAYAFLCTRLGIQAVRSTSYGTKILRFRADLLNSLPMPEPSDAIRKRVASLIRNSLVQRQVAYVLQRQARALLGEDAGVKEAAELVGRRSRKAVAWPGALPTLRGWTYASAGKALAVFRSRSEARLADYIADRGLYQGPRFARVECEAPYGVDLLSQRDVFMSKRIPQRIRQPSIPDRELFPESYGLLLSCDGQLSEGTLFGRVELAETVPVGTAVTEHILRMNPVDGARGLLYAFLSSEVGYRLLQSTAVGTSIPKMRLDLVESLPVPELSAITLQELEGLVSAAATARVAAEEDEARAVGLLETEVIPAWLS